MKDKTSQRLDGIGQVTTLTINTIGVYILNIDMITTGEAMVYYMIRHKATDEFMPQLNGKGYTHWNPSSNVKLSHKKFTGCPRLFSSIRVAKRVIVQWNCMPNAFNNYRHATFLGEDDSFTDIKPDGRKKEDLEVVIVNIEETGVITS